MAETILFSVPFAVNFTLLKISRWDEQQQQTVEYYISKIKNRSIGKILTRSSDMKTLKSSSTAHGMIIY